VLNRSRCSSCLLLLLLLAPAVNAFSVQPPKQKTNGASQPQSPPSIQVDDQLPLSETLLETTVNTGHNSTTTEQSAPSDNASANKKSPAILLNLNARQVVQEMEPMAQDILGSSSVFCTATEDEAREAARDMARNLDDYSIICPVGGDGTLCSAIELLCDALLEEHESIKSVEEALRRLPPIGYIPLGTGNGVGSVVGCQAPPESRSGWRRFFRKKQSKLQSFEATLRHIKDFDESNKNKKSRHEIVEMPMIQLTTKSSDGKTSESTTCFFAGIGFDSLLLNDYSQLKSWAKSKRRLPLVLKQWLSSVAGYSVALVTKTLPQCATTGAHNIQVTVTTNSPNSTLWVDHRRGDMVRPIAAAPNNDEATMLYQGTTGILAASTCPYYGGGLRMFPFARMTTDKMQLRLGRLHPMTGIRNLPGIFAGSYRDKTPDDFGVLDFIGNDFDVYVQSAATAGEGFPLQHSGESVGSVNSFRLQVVPEQIRFVSFLPPVVVESL